MEANGGDNIYIYILAEQSSFKKAQRLTRASVQCVLLSCSLSTRTYNDENEGQFQRHSNDRVENLLQRHGFRAIVWLAAGNIVFQRRHNKVAGSPRRIESVAPTHYVVRHFEHTCRQLRPNAKIQLSIDKTTTISFGCLDCRCRTTTRKSPEKMLCGSYL